MIGRGISDFAGVTVQRCDTLIGPPLAYDLLDDATRRPDLSDALIQAIAHEMSADHSSNNIRRTYRGRYGELDRDIAGLIPKLLPGQEAITLHDAGASNAITSVDLFEAIRHLSQVTMVASDFQTTLRSVALQDGWRAIFGASLDLLQIVGPGIVLPVQLRRRFRKSPLVWLKTRLLAARLGPQAQDILSGIAPGQIREIDLFHPKARTLAQSEPRFSLQSADLTTLPAGSTDVLRVMNVLFKWPRRHRIEVYPALIKALKPGGLLILGSDGIRVNKHVRCTVFRLEGRRLIPVYECGDGFENRDEILAHWNGT